MGRIDVGANCRFLEFGMNHRFTILTTLFGFQHTDTSRHTGGGMDLSSPGSCLTHFSTSPVIECSSRGEHEGACGFYASRMSHWLLAAEQLQPLTPQVIEGKVKTEMKCSRCNVCLPN